MTSTPTTGSTPGTLTGRSTPIPPGPSRSHSGTGLSFLPSINTGPSTAHSRHPGQFETSPLLGGSPARAVPSLGGVVADMAREGVFRRDTGYGTASRGSTGDFGQGSDGDSIGRRGSKDVGQDRLRPAREPKRRQSLRKIVKQRSKYYIPAMDWLPNYKLEFLPGDFVSGITVACLIIPQAMSYASGLAKLPPVAGLYSAALPGLAYSILGTCRQLSVGPEAALSLIVGQVINGILSSDPHDKPGTAEAAKIAAAVSVVITLQVGLVTLALGLLRLGFLDVVLSKALLRGFVTAIGVIILIEQLVPMLGLARLLPAGTYMAPLDKFLFLCRNLEYFNPATATISVLGLGWLIGARLVKARVKGRFGRILRYVPEIFVLVVVATVVTKVCRLDRHGVDVLGHIAQGTGSPFGFPLAPRHLKYFKETFPTAAVIAVVGYVDSVVAAKENAGRFGYAISPNRELVALGASNIVGAFAVMPGAVPVFGAITRSRLNAQVGARSQMASAITSLCVILTTLFLLPYFSFLPKAVLSTIITLVVYAILAEAPHEIKFYWKVRGYTEAFQACMTFLLTLFFNIELGLAASTFFSLVLVIQKSTQTRIKIITRLPGSDEWVPVDETPEGMEAADDDMAGVLVVRIRESLLHFANTSALKERLRRLELYGADKSHPSEPAKRDHAQVIVFHMNDVEEIDASALQIFHELCKAYVERGSDIYVVHIRSQLMRQFERVGIDDVIGLSHFQPNLSSAMQAIGQRNVTDAESYLDDSALTRA